MILNVSGRTDIVAFYSDWFINRYREGFVDVRNPFYNKQVSRIYFSNVDLIVFCTKNPIPIVKYLRNIDKPIIFHVTLTPYRKDIEPNVPPKGLIVSAIKEISSIIGSDNVYIRYDPIFINDKYTVSYHIKAFDNMCRLLNGSVKHIIVSFIDDYKNVRNNKRFLNYRELNDSDYREIGINFSRSASLNGMTVQTCCEENDLCEYGFIRDDCVSFNLAYKKTHKTDFKKWKERSCNCVSMVDIGVYNSCKHFCKYCYANFDEGIVNDNFFKHNPNSSLLIGELLSDDIVKERVK